MRNDKKPLIRRKKSMGTKEHSQEASGTVYTEEKKNRTAARLNPMHQVIREKNSESYMIG